MGHLENVRISRGQPRPHLQSWGRSVPKFLGPSTCARTIWETATKFCKMIKLDERKFLTRSSTPPAQAKTFCDTKADLFAVANLVLYVLDSEMTVFFSRLGA